ncbi:MAG: hypothetical protein AAF970_08860 [Bacteroidota bacterium]
MIKTLVGLACGSGAVYGVMEVPALQSMPPGFTRDRNHQPVDLQAGAVPALLWPPGTATSAAVAACDGFVYFGLNAENGSGLHVYDWATQEGSAEPVTTVSGPRWTSLPLGSWEAPLHSPDSQAGYI